MLFPRSSIYFGVLLVLSSLAFYPLYLMDLLHAPLTRHFHAIFGALWLLILSVQPLLIRLNLRRWHKRVGVFGLVCGAGLIVSLLTSLSYVASSKQSFFLRYGEHVAFLTMLTALLFTFLFLRAIQYRHQVQFHARYMVATGLLTMEPIIERLIAFWIPGMMTSLDDVPLVWFLTYLCVLAVCGVLIWQDKDSTKLAFPFWLVCVFTLFKFVVLFKLTTGTVWTYIFSHVAAVSSIHIFLIASLTIALLVALSWRYPTQAQGKINQ